MGSSSSDYIELTNLLSRMIAAREGLVLAGEGAQRELGLLQQLQQEGLVEGPPWKLTSTGEARHTLGNRVSDHQCIFRVPSDILDPATTICQLIFRLDEHGWTHEVAADSQAVNEAKESPYLVGADPPPRKVWYTRDGNTVFKNYLLALATADDHKLPVPHFALEREYRSLTDPDCKDAPAKRPRARRQPDMDLQVSFANADDWPEDALSLIAIASTAAAKSDRHRVKARAKRPAVPREIRSRSSSSSTSSKSNASSHERGHGGGGVVDGVAGGALAADSRDDDGRSVDGDMEVNPARGARVMDRTVSWGVCFMTPKLDADSDNVHSWQMTCKHPCHGACNKTRAVHLSASESDCIRALKCWAILGKECGDKAAHKAVWEEVMTAARFGDLPSMEQLDRDRIQSVEDYGM